jgi:hypothetical protein
MREKEEVVLGGCGEVFDSPVAQSFVWTFSVFLCFFLSFPSSYRYLAAK